MFKADKKANHAVIVSRRGKLYLLVVKLYLLYVNQFVGEFIVNSFRNTFVRIIYIINQAAKIKLVLAV